MALVRPGLLVTFGLLFQLCSSVKTTSVVRRNESVIGHNVRNWLFGEAHETSSKYGPEDESGDAEQSRREKRMEKKIEKAMGVGNETDPHTIPRKVMGVALNGDHDIGALETSMCIGCFGILGLLIAFSIIRKMVPTIYVRQWPDSTDGDPERTSLHQVELNRISRAGVWDALVKVWKTSPEEEVAQAGLDGWALLEFCRMMSRILSVVMPVVAGTLLPLHYFASDDHHHTLDALSRLDIGNIPHEDWILWIHAGFVWFVVIVCSWQVTLAHDLFTERRHQWLLEVPRPRATTVLVRNIPHMLRSDTALRDYVASVLNNTIIQSVYVVRKTGHLPRLVQQLKDARYDAAMAYHGMTENQDACCWGESGTEELEMCQARVQELERLVVKEQTYVETAARKGDPRVCSSAGFITFNSELSQRLAMREQFTREVTEFRMSMPPDTGDVNYQHLAEDDMNAAWWKWVGTLGLLAVFIFWVPVVVLISGWTTLSSIHGTSPEAQKWADQHPYFETIMSGVLATATLKLFMAFLPSVLHSIINGMLQQRSGANEQLKLQQYLTAFLLIFVVLVTSLGRGLTITLMMIADHPGQIVNLLAASLPSASHFYFNYVVLGWAVLTSDLLRLSNLTKYFFYRKVRGFSVKLAKSYSEPEDQAFYGLGARMSMLMLMTALSFIFCSCSPLIMIFTWTYFLLAQLVYGYLLVFGEAKKPDLGGACWIQALNWFFLVMVIYVGLMVGVLRHLQRHGAILCPSILAVSSLSVLYWARYRVTTFAVDMLPLEEVVKADQDKQGTEVPQDGGYRQPECDPGIIQNQSWADFDAMVAKDT
mmetsp:Transcript_26479/g.47802  ORF Transcript_26479/g.47802 Transcript_26479/m.47802 type:complete len:822 (-) Transcript_26479:77-2542(-)